MIQAEVTLEIQAEVTLRTPLCNHMKLVQAEVTLRILQAGVTLTDMTDMTDVR